MGPGYYDGSNSDNSNNKIMFNQTTGSFGTRSNRFTYDNTDESPGPGQYEGKKDVKS